MGLDEDAARQRFGSDAVSVSFRDLSKVDRAVCEGMEHGFIKLVYDKKSRKIIGATIMSPSSGELISELSVAKASGLSFDKLSRSCIPILHTAYHCSKWRQTSTTRNLRRVKRCTTC